MQAREHFVIGASELTEVCDLPAMDVDDSGHDHRPGVAQEDVASTAASALVHVEKPHINQSSPDDKDPGDKLALVSGGHFLAATTTVQSLCTLLHLALLNNVLTNVEHDGMWPIFSRIVLMWMDITMSKFKHFNFDCFKSDC